MYASYNSFLLLKKKLIPNVENDEEEILYQTLNNIDQNYLLNLFIEKLKTKEIVKVAIKKYQLLDPKKFNNEDVYLEAVERYALSFNLLRPVNVDGSQRGKTRLNWTIEFKIDDKNKDRWKEALSFIEREINISIQKYLR